VGDADLALETVDVIPYDHARNPALAGIADALLAVGNRARAERVIEGILRNARALHDHEPQARTWRAMALALVEVGEIAKAITLLRRAIEAADQISVATHGPSGGAHREVLRAQLAHDLSTAGCMEDAIQLVDSVLVATHHFSVYDQLYLRHVISYVPPTLTRAGASDRARGIIANLPSAWMRVRSLLDIAPILWNLGKSGAAVDAAVSALQNAHELREEDRSEYFAEIAECLCELEESKRAIEVLQHVDDPHRRLSARAKLAHIHVRAGRLSRAMETLEGATIAAERLSTASESNETRERNAEALAEVASALSAGGERAKAEQLIGRALEIVLLIDDEDRRADTLQRVAIGLARSTDPPGIDRLLDTVASLPDERLRSNAIRFIAEAFAKRQVTIGLDRIAQQANSLTEERARMNALFGAAQALSRAGRHDEAIAAWRSAFATLRFPGRAEA
jgi:tetratricopeptide (TPR) repeat protein